MTVGERISDLRKQNGYTRVAFADRLGIPQTTLRNYEMNARKPGHDFLLRIADEFGVTTDFLLGVERVLPYGMLPVKRRKIPFLGDIAAGVPIYAEEEYGAYTVCDEELRCDFALRAVGDSMEPRIHNGDVVFVRAQDDVDDGQIAAVVIDDSATLKHVYHLSGGEGVQLVSENSAYPPMIFNRANSDSIRILGLAVAYQRRL